MTRRTIFEVTGMDYVPVELHYFRTELQARRFIPDDATVSCGYPYVFYVSDEIPKRYLITPYSKGFAVTVEELKECKVKKME